MKICNILGFIFSTSFLRFGEGNEFRIISGRKASTLEFPYQVSLEQWMSHFCGGSIIHRSFVLTAAHCVFRHEIFRPVPSLILRIRVGSDHSNRGGSIYTISKVIPHEGYSHDSNIDQYDIALLKVAKPFKFNDRIKMIAIASKLPSHGEKGWITGYGKLQMMRSASTRHLMAVELPVISLRECRKLLDEVANDMICAGEKTGHKDACTGDSGGPFVVNNRLAGIVAWGIGCGREGLPGVYTNVVFYKKWINRNMKYN